MAKDGTVGHRHYDVSTLRRGVGGLHGAIIYIAVQPPNNKVLWITLAFLMLTAIIWVAFENKRFQGPPIGEEIKRRRAAILAAEKAIGEIA